MLRFDTIPAEVKQLLLNLAPEPALSGFALGGGTSLALRFGHRISIDLDFFTKEPFDTEELMTARSLEGAEVVANATNSLTLDAGGVKVDLLRHSYPLLMPMDSYGGLRLLSLEDVAAMKLNAVSNRGSRKDFFDVAELLRHFSLGDLLSFFTRKYANSDPFTVIRSLAWFDDAELEPDPLPHNGPTWKDVKHQITSAVSKL